MSFMNGRIHTFSDQPGKEVDRKEKVTGNPECGTRDASRMVGELAEDKFTRRFFARNYLRQESPF